MDRLQSRTGFMPGVFGRRQQQPPGENKQYYDDPSRMNSGSSITEKMTPKAHPQVYKIPSTLRNHLIAMIGEFVGTFMFLFMAFAGTQVANTPQTGGGSSSTALTQGPNPQQLMYIALSFGFALTVNAWIFYRVSGGLFNPAVTLALALIGAVPFVRGGLVFIAQLFGGMAAAGVVSALFPGPLAVATTLGGGTSIVQGLFIEMFLTAQLVFTIIMLAAEKNKSTFLAPVGIGLSLFVAELAGVYFTGGSLNPTRSFGPCVVNRSFPGYHWLYWIGPCLGAMLAAGFYWFIKTVEYQTANPGQDFDDIEAKAFDPTKDMGRPIPQPTHVADRTETMEMARINSGEPMDPNLGNQPIEGRLSTGSRHQFRDPNLSSAPTAKGYDHPRDNRASYEANNRAGAGILPSSSATLPVRDSNEGRAYYEPSGRPPSGSFTMSHSGSRGRRY